METYALMKTCCCCNEAKTYDEFNVKSDTQDGWQSHCRSCERTRQASWFKTIHGRSNRLFNNARNRAKKKGLPFDLTNEWIEDKLKVGHCGLTGLPFDLESHPVHYINPRSPSLDRIDSYKGYTMDNVMVVCNQANTAKGAASDRALKEFCITYLEHTHGYTLTDKQQLTKGTIDD